MYNQLIIRTKKLERFLWQHIDTKVISDYQIARNRGKYICILFLLYKCILNPHI